MTHTILFAYNLDLSGGENPQMVECSTADTVDRIFLALQNTGNTVFKLNLFSPEELENCLGRLPAIDFVFNIAEGFLHAPRTMYDGSGAARIKAVFNKLNLPVSHSSAQTMIKCRNKQLTNLVLRRSGIPTPEGFVIYDRNNLSNLQGLKFPVFIKPLSGGSSLGIDEGSVVDSYPRLAARVNYLQGLLDGAGLLVEEYLPGPEYTVAVIGNKPLIILPPASFKSNLVRSTDIKRQGFTGPPCKFIDRTNQSFFEPADLAVKAFKALGAADAIRVDIKENNRGEKYMIDVNGTPSLSSTGSLYRSARHLGLDFQQTVALILACSMQRYGLPWSKKLTGMMADLEKNLEPYYHQGSTVENREQVL